MKSTTFTYIKKRSITVLCFISAPVSACDKDIYTMPYVTPSVAVSANTDNPALKAYVELVLQDTNKIWKAKDGTLMYETEDNFKPEFLKIRKQLQNIQYLLHKYHRSPFINPINNPVTFPAIKSSLEGISYPGKEVVTLWLSFITNQNTQLKSKL